MKKKKKLKANQIQIVPTPSVQILNVALYRRTRNRAHKNDINAIRNSKNSNH